MNDKNMYAIIGMCAIVITLYALKESHTHYLPDFFGLVLALASTRPSYGVGAVALLALIRHTPIGLGLANGIPNWLLVVALPAAYNMSIREEESRSLESAYLARILEEKDEEEIDEIPQPVAEISTEKVHLIESELLAKLVIAGALKLTEAVQIGAGAKSGKKYSQRSAMVKEAMERQRNHYPPGSTHNRFE